MSDARAIVLRLENLHYEGGEFIRWLVISPAGVHSIVNLAVSYQSPDDLENALDRAARNISAAAEATSPLKRTGVAPI